MSASWQFFSPYSRQANAADLPGCEIETKAIFELAIKFEMMLCVFMQISVMSVIIYFLHFESQLLCTALEFPFRYSACLTWNSVRR